MAQLPITHVSSKPDYDNLPSNTWEAEGVVDIATIEQGLIKPWPLFSIEGECAVCNRKRQFVVDYAYIDESAEPRVPNWRERLTCLFCLFNNRLRGSVHVFETVCNPSAESRIYITEQKTPMYRYIHHNYHNTVGSEFFGEHVERGAMTQSGVRNEDLCNLSFPDRSFDFLLSYDVFEHIPDYRRALEESYRVLDEAGVLLLSVPFCLNNQSNLVRATKSQSGEITHLLPPEYHGNPTTGDACLCYYHFGWDMLEDIRAAGFDEAELLVFWSRKFCYLGGRQIMILARKKTQQAQQIAPILPPLNESAQLPAKRRQ